VVLVRGSAETRQQAETLTDLAVTAGIRYFNGLDQPYRIEQIADAPGTSKRTDTARSLLYVSLGAAALVTYLAMRQLALIWHAARRARALAEAGGPDEAGA
jgi:hypothetical protein